MPPGLEKHSKIAQRFVRIQTVSRRSTRQRRLPRRKLARRAAVRALVRARAGARRRRRRVHRAAGNAWLRLRVARRKAFLVLWTLFIYALWMACWPIAWVSERPMRPLRRGIHRLWGRGLLWGTGARVKITGKRPKAPFFLVANHLSYVDAFLLAGEAGGAFVARADMAHWPIFGWMMRNAYQAFINREDMRDATRVLQIIDDVIEKKDGVIMFPEGWLHARHAGAAIPSRAAAGARSPKHAGTLRHHRLFHAPGLSRRRG
jgi:1-acyl-sn-glycerol-3-phosphate acyltransferase